MHLDIKWLLRHAQWSNTLLGICSTSEEIIIASFKEAIEGLVHYNYFLIPSFIHMVKRFPFKQMFTPTKWDNLLI